MALKSRGRSFCMILPTYCIVGKKINFWRAKKVQSTKNVDCGVEYSIREHGKSHAKQQVRIAFVNRSGMRVNVQK